jgi:glycosyltransferase involved in cell wall biosynthesis
MLVSIILPVYNDCINLQHNFRGIYNQAQRLGSFEIIIAEDGSTDCTKHIVEKLGRLKGVRTITATSRKGRGAALKDAIKIANGDIIGYLDIDLSTPASYIGDAVKLVSKGHKFVIGSRYSKGANARRSFSRLISSRVYNALIYIAFGSRVRDHQCGFKFWDGKFIKGIISKVVDNHWFFDTELIIRAQVVGIHPYELPVKWKESNRTTVRLSDVLYFLEAIIKLKCNMPKGKERMF